MIFIGADKAEFEAVVALLSDERCLYAIISTYDWHIRLCFVRLYPRPWKGQSGRTIINGDWEIVTNGADWTLYDWMDNMVASNMGSGFGDRTKDYFTGRKWQIDASALPNFVMRCDEYRLEVEAYEDTDEDHSVWDIWFPGGCYGVYRNVVTLHPKEE